MSKTKPSRTQQQLFKENPDLKKAYAAAATRKSRERKRQEQVVLSQRNLLLESDKETLKRRIDCLRDEIRHLEGIEEANNPVLILEHEALSTAVKRHRVMFDEIRNAIMKDVDSDVIFTLSTTGLKHTLERLLQNLKSSTRTNWEIFCEKWEKHIPLPCFDLVNRIKIYQRVRTNSSNFEMCYRFDLKNIKLDTEILHEAIWLLSSKTQGLQWSFEEVSNILYPSHGVSIKSECCLQKEKHYICSDIPPNRTFLTETRNTKNENELYLTAELQRSFKESDIYGDRERESGVNFVLKKMLIKSDLKSKLVRHRLNQAESNEQAYENRCLQAFTVSNFSHKKQLCDLTILFELSRRTSQQSSVELTSEKVSSIRQLLVGKVLSFLERVGTTVLEPLSDNKVDCRYREDDLTLKLEEQLSSGDK